MQKKNWVIAGIYLGALLLGWGGSFALSQWADRETSLPENAQVKIDKNPQSKANAKASKEPSKSSKSSTSKPMSLESYLKPIIARSIFDSTKVNAKAPVVNDAGDSDYALTDLDVRLLATIVAIPAEYSVALILINKSSQSHPYAVGDTLIEDAVIHEIKQKEVILKRGNTFETLTTGKEEKTSKSKITLS